MVSASWRALDAELARWRDAGREAQLWWRDDDAARADPALERLLQLSHESATPLALAAVPMAAEAAIFASLPRTVAVLQHGADHRNRAAEGEKKSEFPESEDAGSAARRLEAGRARLASLAGARLLPVLAPPWNRFPEARKAALAASGFRGISQYGPRAAAMPAPGLRQINTHIDLIAWRGDRGFVGEAQALEAAVRQLAARREGSGDRDEPLGWLTHHALHDDAAWEFLALLFERTRVRPGACWSSAEALFHT